MDNRQSAQFYDNKIFQLAFYYESKGMSISAVNPEKVYARFSDFKRMLLEDEFKFYELEDRVYGEFGIKPINSEYDSTSTVDVFLRALEELSEELSEELEQADNGKEEIQKEQE